MLLNSRVNLLQKKVMLKIYGRDISIKDNQIKLTNRYEEIEEILGGFDELEWIAL